MGRLRRRLDELQGHAHATMNDAQDTAETATNAIEELHSTLAALLEDIHDGVTLQIDLPDLPMLPDRIEVRLKLKEGDLRE